MYRKFWRLRYRVVRFYYADNARMHPDVYYQDFLLDAQKIISLAIECGATHWEFIV